MFYSSINKKVLVEDCYKLRLSDLPKGLLNPDKKITGIIEKQKGLDQIKINFERMYNDREFAISIHAKKKKSSFDQEIILDFAAIPFGIRPYLLCSCGRRCNTLYLKPNTYEFACRDCHNLVYELTTINRNVYGAELLYRHNRVMKIEEMKELVKRPIYNGKISKKAKSLMSMIAKWKIDAIAESIISKNIMGLDR